MINENNTIINTNVSVKEREEIETINDIESINNSPNKSQKYKCVKSNKSSSLFNRKLERPHTKTNKNYTRGNNSFYTNHYYNKNRIKHNIYNTINTNTINTNTINTNSINSINTNIIHSINTDSAYSINANNVNTKFNNKLHPYSLTSSEFVNVYQSSHSIPKNIDKYCINCGNNGHAKGQCNEPNISNGVIAIRFNMDTKEYEYFIVMRKHSHGYCDIMRGKYTDNVKHIKQLLEETTIEERNYLINNDFHKNWTYLWGEKNNMLSKYKNTNNMEKKFETFKQKYLYKLLPEITTIWVEPEWGFPKGQRELNEKNIYTAFREFSEESGYSSDKCVCISNILPLQEIFIGSNNKQYKQLYYVAFMNYEDTIGEINFQSNEIGDACWSNIHNVILKFRNYDVSKIKIAKDVSNLIENSIFVDV
jgi:hypothetical protein